MGKRIQLTHLQPRHERFRSGIRHWLRPGLSAAENCEWRCICYFLKIIIIIMKRILYIVIPMTVLTTMESCKKGFLDQVPLDKYSDAAVWQDPALVQTFANNIYLGISYPFTTLMLSSTVDESMAVWDWE